MLIFLPDLNIRPFSKNFVFTNFVDESLLWRISKISRSFVTFNVNDRWIESGFVSLLKTIPNIKYNIVISGDTSKIRIKNIKQLNPQKVGYVVNEFVDLQKVDELNMLKPHSVFLIFKRIPEDFELFAITQGKIREIVVILDVQSAVEFLSGIEKFNGFRVILKPVQKEAFENLCRSYITKDLIKIVFDSRILDIEHSFDDIVKDCKDKIIYEISSSTYYNNYIKFIKSNITELNIHYDTYAKSRRDDVIEWILKTDP
ncbi:MAG: hypothetical protein N2746_00275 [Deltaproteobacteria bacterium]|nr:hypothetical protein [Deltaproteobacteria bacterium]